MILREKVKTLSVPLVDDVVDVLKRSVVFMQKFFECVDSANSAEETLKKFSDHDGYDIVMTDIKMAGMSGWDLIKQLREIDENLFIAAMTGSPDATDMELKLTDLYLNKPVSVDKMVGMLEKIIKKQECSYGSSDT